MWLLAGNQVIVVINEQESKAVEALHLVFPSGAVYLQLSTRFKHAVREALYLQNSFAFLTTCYVCAVYPFVVVDIILRVRLRCLLLRVLSPYHRNLRSLYSPNH